VKLVLGVADVPYARKGGETTAGVAHDLEARYHIMQRFASAHERFIAKQLASALPEAFENLLASGRQPQDIFAGACSEIEERFRLFLDLRELDHAGDPGIPTQASLRGVNHRLAKPYSKDNPPRSSFIDTGEYQINFKCWVES
jgi:hypothetical protein